MTSSAGDDANLKDAKNRASRHSVKLLVRRYLRSNVFLYRLLPHTVRQSSHWHHHRTNISERFSPLAINNKTERDPCHLCELFSAIPPIRSTDPEGQDR